MAISAMNGMRLLVAATLARATPTEGLRRARREEPRTERFFDRLFPFLVRCEGALIPVRLAFGEAGDGARERAAVEAAARAARN